MVLTGILPSASIAHRHGTCVVFGVLVLFAAAPKHSSSCTDELFPEGLGFISIDMTASYGEDISESGFFPNKSSSFVKKLYLLRASVASYKVDIWKSEFFPSPFSSCKEELVLIVGAITGSYGENIWESEFFPSASFSCKEELLLGASTAWHRENIHLTMLIVQLFFWILGLCILEFLDTNLRKDRHEWRYRFELDLAMLEAEEHRRDTLQPLLCPPSLRFSANNDLPGMLSRTGCLEILPQGIDLAIAYMHEESSTHIIHLDIKPANVLLDSDVDAKVSTFLKESLQHGNDHTPVRKYLTRVPKYFSIQHRLVKIMLPARNKFAEQFPCIKSMVPKSIFDMAKRLCSSVLPNGCKADWNSASSMSESTKLGTVSEFDTRKSTTKRNELTENESDLSDTDMSGAEHGIKEVKANTEADWIAATAAPHHATGNRDLLSGFVIEHDDQFVPAVDGVPRKVVARGAVITDAVVLPDVWFVPGLTENLVSVSQLAELDHSIGFGRGECCIRSARDAKIVGKGRLQKGGHYVLDYLKLPLAI